MNKLFEQMLLQNQDQLVNYKNYKVFKDFVQRRENLQIYVPNLCIENIDDYIDGIEAILQDGIETSYVHNLRVALIWENGLQCSLSIIDAWFSLFMWNFILKTDQKIRPKHIFWSEELKKDGIKKFIDKFVLTIENKIKFGNHALNNIICDCAWNYSRIEQFSSYLANTINNEDDIYLMKACDRFRELIHCSLADEPIENVKDKGLQLTHEGIDIIKNSEKFIGYYHGLAHSFMASEAISDRQFKEAYFNIGTKPNGSGSIYPYIIDKSFKTGGVNDPVSFLVEATTGRTAQIINKIAIGNSGEFGRILGLNNTDTLINPDPNYDCMSRNYVAYDVIDKKRLSMVKNRYFRFNPNGLERVVDEDDTTLIGKTIYMRSPMTCASFASRNCICRKCYGNLYYTNRDINVGKIAAELVSSKLSQKKLSAKHILESKVIPIEWCPEFSQFFDIDNLNEIVLSSQFVSAAGESIRRYYLYIDPDNVSLVNDETNTINTEDEYDDGIMFNEYITHFFIKNPEGNIVKIFAKDDDEMYLSTDINNIIRRRAENSNGLIKISLADLVDTTLFTVQINNNELIKIIKNVEQIFKNPALVSNNSIDVLLQVLCARVIDAGLDVDSIHLEVMIANQLRDPENILEKPKWNSINPPYKILTLNHALVNNPSVIVSMLYQDLNKVLYNPLSYTKHAPSYFDMFFCEQPQVYMSDELLTDEVDIREHDTMIDILEVIDDDKDEKERDGN